MAFSYGFYNSLNHDRTYDAEDVSRLFDGLITDGVIGSIGDTFAVKASSGSSVTVGSGRAWFNHSWSYNDTQMVVDCGSAGVILDRYDAVVLEMDNSPDVRANSIKVVHGEEASSPAKPAMTSSEFVHQYPLAYILRKAGSDAITQGNIENAVGTSACPLATGVLQGMSADQIIAQWAAANKELLATSQQNFNEWFSDVKATLDENVAGNLLNKINAADNEYSVTLTLDGWVASGITDYPFAQTVVPVATKGTAPGVTESSEFLGQAYYTPTTSAATNSAMNDVLELINGGITYCGDNSIKVCVESKPTAEIVAKWRLKG